MFYTKKKMLFVSYVSQYLLGTQGVFEMGQPRCLCLFRTGYKSLLSGSPANKQLSEEHSTPTAASIGEQMTQL